MGIISLRSRKSDFWFKDVFFSLIKDFDLKSNLRSLGLTLLKAGLPPGCWNECLRRLDDLNVLCVIGEREAKIEEFWFKSILSATRWFIMVRCKL